MTTQLVFRQEVGHGSYGSVIRTDAMGNGLHLRSAFKVYGNCTSSYESFETCLREFLGLTFSSVPRSLIQSYSDENPTNLGLLMKTYDGTLSSMIRRWNNPLSEDLIRSLFFPIVTELYFMHREGYAHQDLSPTNILIDCEAKKMSLCDFGISGSVPNDNEVVQTLWYRPPECKSGSHDTKADVFSLALVMLHTFLGRPLIQTDDEDRWYSKASNVKLDELDEWRKSPLWTLLDKCLQENPETRPSMQELIQDPFWKMPRKFMNAFEEDSFWDFLRKCMQDRKIELSSRGLSFETKKLLTPFQSCLHINGTSGRMPTQVPPPNVRSKCRHIQKRLGWSNLDLVRVLSWICEFERPSQFQQLTCFQLVYLFNCKRRGNLHNFREFVDAVMEWDSESSDDSYTVQDYMALMMPHLVFVLEKTQGLPLLGSFQSKVVSMNEDAFDSFLENFSWQ